MLCMETIRSTEALEWTVGDRLRKAREMSRIRVGVMARHLHRDRNTINRYEHSRRVDVLVVRAYAAITGVPFAWLEHGDTGSDTGPDAGGLTPEYSRRRSDRRRPRNRQPIGSGLRAA